MINHGLKSIQSINSEYGEHSLTREPGNQIMKIEYKDVTQLSLPPYKNMDSSMLGN